MRAIQLVVLGTVLGLASTARAQPAPWHRQHPDFAARIAAVKTVGLAAPTLEVFEIDVGNHLTLKPDWTEKARANVTAALESILKEKGFATRRLAASGAGADELRDTALLYESVGGAILQATYFNQFPAKLARFEYGLGDLDALMSAAGVDAILFTYGHGNYSSGGRTALRLLVDTGSGIDRLYFGLVDRRGDVLWFCWDSSTDEDLRGPNSARSFANQILRYLTVPR